MKQTLCIIALILNAFALNAQIYVKSTGQTMVENAVKPALVIVHSSFQIKDNKTGVLYGLNGKKEFGEYVSFGIMTKEGMVLNEDALFPWNYNEKFSKYRNEYSPILSAIQYSNIGATLHDSLDIDLDKNVLTRDSSFYYYKYNSFDGDGLVIDDSIGEKAGWLLWITIPKDADFGMTSDPAIIVQQKNIEITRETDVVNIIAPQTNYCIRGGLFIVPCYERIGIVEFRLAGGLKGENEEWELYCPFYNLEKETKADANENGSETEVEETPSTEELTPVDDKPAPGKRKRI